MNANHSCAYPVNIKRAISFAILLLATASTSANAFFFFFLPGSATSKISDAITGSEGDNCVSATAKVGDTITSINGNTAVIKSLSGTSSRCQDTKLPIRALLQFNYSFSSKAGIDLPEGFKPNELSPTELFNGVLLNAQDASKRIGVFISAQPRKGDGDVLAKNIATKLLSAVDDGKTSNDEDITINGMHAYRFRMVGKNKGVFGRSFTYVVTVLVGNDEFVQVNANCLTSDFEKYKDMLDHFAYDVKGLNVAQQLLSQDVVQPSASIPVPIQSSTSEIKVDVRVGQNPKLSTTSMPVKTTPASPTEASPASAPVVSPSNTLPAQSESAASRLRALKALYKDGVINQKDFEAKKQEILKSM